MNPLLLVDSYHCKGCDEIKDISEFSKDKYRKSGHSFRCKTCRAKQTKRWADKNRDKILQANLINKENRKLFYQSEKGIESSRRSHLKRMYNITLEDYNKMSEEQDHKCYICGKSEMNYKNKVLCVDHNHDTGQVRALLCGLCNSGLGKFLENKQLLLNAINYLEKYEPVITG